MGEIVTTCFDALIIEVNALPILRSQKDAMIAQLNFLRLQSLCDYDRRRPVADLREAWNAVDREMERHGLYERYKPSKKIWDTIGMFVEIGAFRPAPTKRQAVVKAPSKLLNLHLPDLFKEMHSECSGIPHIKERMTLKKGLEFLTSEAEKPLYMRHQAEIRITWKQIHAPLKARGVLQSFDEEPMKTKILAFLKGAGGI